MKTYSYDEMIRKSNKELIDMLKYEREISRDTGNNIVIMLLERICCNENLPLKDKNV